MSPVTIQLFYTLEETLLFSLVTIGMFVSFRLLKFPDLTAEGGFGFAAVMGGIVLAKTGSPTFSVLAGVAAGAFCGLVTALLANIAKLPTILASILTMTMSISAGLLIAGKPSSSLPDLWFIRNILPIWDSPVTTGLIGGALVLMLIVSALLVFCRTGMGFLLRARGENPRLTRELNRSLLAWDVVGLCLANGIVGFAAVLFAQRSGYASVNMGRGVAIAALAAIMLGESLFYNHTIKQALIGCIIGTLVLRLVRLLALNLGMPDGTLDLVTSSMVVVFYYLAKGRSEKGAGVLENIRV
jgi:putative ABC transport system permease protein